MRFGCVVAATVGRSVLLFCGLWLLNRFRMPKKCSMVIVQGMLFIYIYICVCMCVDLMTATLETQTLFIPVACT